MRIGICWHDHWKPGRMPRRLIPPHVNFGRPEPQEPPAAPGPSAPDVASRILDGDSVDRLVLTAGPEERPFDEPTVFALQQPQAVFAGPLIEDVGGTTQVPEQAGDGDGSEDDEYEQAGAFGAGK